MGKAKGTSDA
jgi:ribosome biogenesis protein ERB1